MGLSASLPISFRGLSVIKHSVPLRIIIRWPPFAFPFNVWELLQNVITTAQKGFFTNCLLWKLPPSCAFHLHTQAASTDVSVTNNVYNF